MLSGVEPALQPNADETTGGVVTDTGSLPEALLGKLEALRIGGKT